MLSDPLRELWQTQRSAHRGVVSAEQPAPAWAGGKAGLPVPLTRSLLGRSPASVLESQAAEDWHKSAQTYTGLHPTAMASD
jgi:hypothetical protein